MDFKLALLLELSIWSVKVQCLFRTMETSPNTVPENLEAFDMQRCPTQPLTPKTRHFAQMVDLQRRCDVKCRIKMDSHSCEDT